MAAVNRGEAGKRLVGVILVALSGALVVVAVGALLVTVMSMGGADFVPVALAVDLALCGSHGVPGAEAFCACAVASK